MAERLLEWVEMVGGPCDGQIYEVPRGATTLRLALPPDRQVAVFIGKHPGPDGRRIAKWSDRWPD